MSLESSPVIVAQFTCPRCGGVRTRPAPEDADEAAIARFQLRIRAMTSAASEQGRSVPGPDGALLWSGVLVWIGAVVYMWMAGYGSTGITPWVLLLGGLVLGGAWADRRAARKRGWIDPMKRADEIARDVLSREAFMRANADTGDARVCLQCGHRFQATVDGVSSPA